MTPNKQIQATERTTPGVVLSGNSASSSNFRLPGTFSWWDPGMFFQDFVATISPLRSTTQEALKSNAAENAFIPGSANRPVATSDVSCGCNRRFSSSTNEESKYYNSRIISWTYFVFLIKMVKLIVRVTRKITNRFESAKNFSNPPIYCHILNFSPFLDY